VVLAMGLLLTALLGHLVEEREETRRRSDLQRRLDQLSTQTQRTLDKYTNVLLALGDYQRVKGSLNKREFHSFVERSVKENPGLHALEWAPIVQSSRRLQFEEMMRQEGTPSFLIRPMTPGDFQGDIHVPVAYVAPVLRNEAALGADLWSHDLRREVLRMAMRTGRLATTPRVRLIQERESQFGVLLVQPSSPETPLPGQGFTIAVLRVSDVIEESTLGMSVDLSFSLWDAAAPAGEAFLGLFHHETGQMVTGAEAEQSSATSPSLCGLASACSRVLTVGNRSWTLRAVADGVRGTTRGQIWVWLLGQIVSLSLALYLLLSARYMHRIERLVGERDAANVSLRQRNEQLARSMQESEEVREHLVEELGEAAQFLRSLLPPELEHPVRLRWRFVPCAQLGGDALGVEALGEGRLAFFVLDVCGHGVASALVAITLLSAFRTRSLAADLADPAATLGALNDTFPRERFGGLHFTIWYGVVDLQRRELRYASAGHPPALLVSSEGVQELATENPLIGLVPQLNFSENSVNIPPDGTLFVFSDGAYELPSRDGTIVPYSSFLEAVQGASPQDDPLEHLVAWAQEVAGPALPDDLTLLMLRFEKF
jgi:serine phosphatase RsbU (regulator of sigma subunit)